MEKSWNLKVQKEHQPWKRIQDELRSTKFWENSTKIGRSRIPKIIPFHASLQKFDTFYIKYGTYSAKL